MGPFSKLQRTWNLTPDLKTVQRIPVNYFPCLCLSIGRVWSLHGMWFNIYLKMHPVSCSNTHHEVTHMVNHGKVENTKTWTSWEGNITFLPNKKIVNVCLRLHILRTYYFLVYASFKYFGSKNFVTDLEKVTWDNTLNVF